MLEEWGETLINSLERKRYPIGGMFELNERCNLSCVHCFINHAVNDRAARDTELSTEQVKTILDQVAEAGCLFFTLTGGEPLVRPDFSEIYLYARRKGLLMTVFTNATMITPHIADVLASSPPQLVEITLYGATKETYESVTRVRGSYEHCMNGIRLLLDRGIKIGLKAVLLTLNRHELPQMQALADAWGANFRYDGTIWPRTNGDEGAYRYRLSIDEMIALDQENPGRLTEWKKRKDMFDGSKVRNEYVFSCGAGLRTFHITSTGDLCACIMVRKPSYNLLEMDFKKAWERIGEIREWTRQKHTICETCTVGALCAQCPGWSLIVHGDYETPVDYICRLGKARAGQI
jgi:radical SAM protein with 4Fe4S-binding SPASM domain